MNWINLALNRDQWRTLTNTLISEFKQIAEFLYRLTNQQLLKWDSPPCSQCELQAIWGLNDLYFFNIHLMLRNKYTKCIY